MIDHDERVRRAFTPATDHAQNERTWNSVRTGISLDPAASPKRRRRPRALALLIALVVLVVISGAAIAAEPGLLDHVFPAGSDSEKMQVMRQPPAKVPQPPLPADVREVLDIFSQNEDPLQFDEYRVLLDHRSGKVHTTLYAIPTKSGAICHFWHGTFGSGGCAETGFRNHGVVSYSSGHFGLNDGWDTTTSITGLATDAVAEVRVRLANGTVEDAIMGRNSFLWYPTPYDDLYRYAASKHPEQLPRLHRSEPEALIIALTDGTTRELNPTS